MNELWGISRPAFAWLYTGLVVVPMLVGMLITWSARRGRKAPSSKRLPTIYHVAYLAGGPDRVTDTVVAAMIEREQLRVSSSGELHTTPNQPIAPLEVEAMTHVASRSATTAFSLREPIRASAPMASLAAELAQQGLVVPEARRLLVWRIVLWVYVAVFVLGIVRVASAADLGQPIGVLVFLAVAGTAIAGLRTRPSRKGETTKAGRAAFEVARGDRSLVAGAAGIVTRRGLRRYPDYELAKALTKSHPPNPRNQRSGSFGYSSGGYVSGIAWGGNTCGSGGGNSCAANSCGGGGSSCGGGGGGSSCGGGGGGGG
jgi:uncharacterized protein (TIGR04222 family)